MTGADVAASKDPTGAASKGGNWKLEFTTGAIETPVAVSETGQAAWDALLAPPVVNLNGSSGTVTVATDTFGSSTYSGGSGWSSDWVEFDASPTRFIAGTSNSDNTPASGNVVYGTSAGAAADTSIAFVGHGNQFNDSIQRSVNLLSYTTATLTFTYKLQNIESPDAVVVQASKDGGATFTTLGLPYSTNTRQLPQQRQHRHLELHLRQDRDPLCGHRRVRRNRRSLLFRQRHDHRDRPELQHHVYRGRRRGRDRQCRGDGQRSRRQPVHRRNGDADEPAGR